METFQEVAESQGKKEESEGTGAAAELLEKLSVEEKKDEKKAEEDVTAATTKDAKEPEKAESKKEE